MLTLKQQDGHLTLECLTLAARLEHYQYDTFSVPAGSPTQPHPFGNEELTFHLDADGQAASVRFLNSEFRRIP